MAPLYSRIIALARLPFLLGLAATVLALAGCAPSSPEAEQAKAIKELILVAEQPKSWPQKDVSHEAGKIFAIGETAESYAPLMKSLGFKQAISHVRGRRSVSFFKRDLTVPEEIIGHVELRFVLFTDDDDRVQSVLGKIFLHTL